MKPRANTQATLLGNFAGAALDGNLVCHFDAVSLAEIIYLGEKVTESLFRFLHSFVAAEDERIVHHLVACLLSCGLSPRR